MVVTDGHRLDVEPVLLAAEQRIGVRGARDADQQPIVLPAEIRQGGGAVVDERAARERERGGCAGVRGGEDIQIVGIHEAVELVLAKDVLQRFARAVPSADELLVAVRDAHAAAGDLDEQRRGTSDQQLLELRALVDGDGEHLVDAVRPAHGFIGRALRIGASAAHPHVDLTPQLCLDIAHQRQKVRAGVGDRLLEGGEVVGGLVEPMHIAVEHRQDLARLLGDHPLHRVERERVTVQAAHDVEHLARSLGRSGERLGGDMVVDGAHPARIFEQTAFLARHRAGRHRLLFSLCSLWQSLIGLYRVLAIIIPIDGARDKGAVWDRCA